MKRSIIILSTLVALSTACLSAQSAHDGAWWVGLSPGAKENVITGFLDGMALGQNLALMGAGSSSDPGCRSTIAQSYTYVRTRYFRNVTASDVVSALDSLYGDSENGSIIIGRAVWIAVNRLAGMRLRS
jgi:hypothetical protein